MRKSSLFETTPHCPAIFDDLVFHLDGALRLSEAPSGKIPRLLEFIGFARLESFVAPIRALTPPAIKDLLRSILRRPIASVFDRPRAQWTAQAMASACEQLLANPGSYIEWLRGRGSGAAPA